MQQQQSCSETAGGGGHVVYVTKLIRRVNSFKMYNSLSNIGWIYTSVELTLT